MTRSKGPLPSGRVPPSPASDAPEPRKPAGSWFDRAVASWVSLARFTWDAVGVFLIAIGLILLLGFTGLTQGAFLKNPIEAVRIGLGIGAYLVVIFLVWLGLIAIRRRKAGQPLFRLNKVIIFEAWGFILIINLAAWGGASLERSSAGLDGGVVGWGLLNLFEKLIPYPFSLFVLGFLLFSFTLWAFGVVGWLIRTAEAWLFAPRTPHDLSQAEQKFLGDQSQQSLDFSLRAEGHDHSRDSRLPPLDLLDVDNPQAPEEEDILETAHLLETTLAEFGIPAEVTGYRVGPTVTQFAVEPGYIERETPEGISRQKVRVSQISALSRDLALALAAERLRIEAPVPGKSFVGIEVPNPRISVVRLRSLLESPEFNKVSSDLAVILGRDVSGQPLLGDLARMPHLLIAGTTGSGKSVCIAALTTCLVMNNIPDDLRLAMLDPKMVELIRFNGLPHLLGKVETEIERMIGVLRWGLAEMDHRYRLLEEANVRDLAAYNFKMERRRKPTLPRVVILVDELADLMMSAPEQTEECLIRLAQMARAVGIHLVVATQRPSTDVVTGLIKANFPARIAFTVASAVDSRVILDTNGAETLLGRGDMLFLNPEAGIPARAQGVYVTDAEIQKVVDFWKSIQPPASEPAAAPWEEILREDLADGDSLLEQAVSIVRSTQRASASMLQRRLRIGYPRAARLIDELEERGVVGPTMGGGKEREVLLPPEDEDDDL